MVLLWLLLLLLLWLAPVRDRPWVRRCVHLARVATHPATPSTTRSNSTWSLRCSSARAVVVVVVAMTVVMSRRGHSIIGSGVVYTVRQRIPTRARTRDGTRAVVVVVVVMVVVVGRFDVADVRVGRRTAHVLRQILLVQASTRFRTRLRLLLLMVVVVAGGSVVAVGSSSADR